MQVRPVLAPPCAVPTAHGKPPTFSVIIPAYQAAAFIADAIDSVLTQTLPALELVVCDDGSTDDLEGSLGPYRDSIIYLRKENGGEASAKNRAARATSGEFVAILDADDVYLPERLEALAELSVGRPDLDILTTDCFVVAEGRVIRRCYQGAYRFETGDQRRGILERNFVGPGHMAVRRDRLLAIGGFDEAFRHATDWDCWIRMIFAGSRVGMVDEPLAEYRVRETSLASDRARQFAAYIAVLQKTAARSDLSADERSVLYRSLDAQRRRLAVREAQIAFLEKKPNSRRLALDIALDNGFPARTRTMAALAAALPRLVGGVFGKGSRELAGGVHISSA
jgi:glycosyltransferase involved in cell wall biosynthesis